MKPLRFALAAGLFALGTSAALADEVTLNAIHFTPSNNSFAQSFLTFVDKVNEAGKGVVQIRVRGGPEVIPTNQQGQAQQNGLVDMINTPAGLYLEIVPEGEALSATAKTPEEIRENGGWELMQEIFGEKANAHLLAHVDAGSGFNVFTVNEPTGGEDGCVDWSALKIRASPLYRQFFESLGTTVIVLQAGEVYTALERGVIDANAYPVFGYASFGWDKFTKYRVEPQFFSTDVLISMNKDAWESLSPEAQQILQEVALEHERSSAQKNREQVEAEAKAMEDNGQTVVTLEGECRDDFLAKAAKASWDRMSERDPTRIDALREHFQ